MARRDRPRLSRCAPSPGRAGAGRGYGRVPPARGAVARDHRRHGDGPRPQPLRGLLAAAALLLPRRQRRGPALGRDLRLHRPPHAALRARPRAGLPAHEHPARRRRRRAARTHLPAAGRAGALRRVRGRPARRPPHAGRHRPARLPGRARSRFLRTRPRRAAGRRPPRPAPRPHHGHDLPPPARRHRRRRLPRARRAAAAARRAEAGARAGRVVAQPMKRVAVIGGGYAGLACAVELARGGAQVTLFERSHTLGGRARVVARDGRRVDNGQHILIGAYTELARLMRLTGQSPKSLLRLPLTLVTPGRLTLVAARLPAPLHLAAGLLRAKGLDWADRRAMLRLMRHLKRHGWRVEPDTTVDALLRETAQ